MICVGLVSLVSLVYLPDMTVSMRVMDGGDGNKHLHKSLVTGSVAESSRLR